MIPEEVENKLEYWDLFKKKDSLYTGRIHFRAVLRYFLIMVKAIGASED